MKAIPFLPAAQDEFLAAFDHYNALSHEVASAFIEEVERTLSRIATFPNHGTPYHGGTRRIVLRRFPYDVVYRQLDDGPHVVAVAHHRRSPFYWRRRLRGGEGEV